MKQDIGQNREQAIRRRHNKENQEVEKRADRKIVEVEK